MIGLDRAGSRILIRGAQQNFDPRGGPSPKLLKIAWKLHDFEKILGAEGPGPQGSLDPPVLDL